MRRGWLSRWSVAALLIVIAFAGYVSLKRRGDARQVDLRVPMTPERIARGHYIYALAGCDGCHSKRDWSRFAGPVISSHRGEGVEFPAELGFAGKVVSANITPDRESGLGSWSDAEKIRAIRAGVSRDGRRLCSIMPYRRYQHMSDEDAYSLVAYLNTLAPLKHLVDRAPSLLPAVLLRAIAPDATTPVRDSNRSDPVAYGRYLATIAGCQGCHTAGSRSTFTRAIFAGGRSFHLPGGTVVSANLTPDPYTGIGRWSEQDWLDRIYRYREYAEGESPKVGAQSLTVMPWLELSLLAPDDLRAIYRYLRTQKAVYRLIDPHPVN